MGVMLTISWSGCITALALRTDFFLTIFSVQPYIIDIGISLELDVRGSYISMAWHLIWDSAL